MGERKRGGKKRSTNKSKREKFWPERKALIFEVLSSLSERFGYTTNTLMSTHALIHGSGKMLSKDQNLWVTQRRLKAESARKKKEKGNKFGDTENVQMY